MLKLFSRQITSDSTLQIGTSRRMIESAQGFAIGFLIMLPNVVGKYVVSLSQFALNFLGFPK